MNVKEIIAEARRYYPLKDLKDDEIAPFVESAIKEIGAANLSADDYVKAAAYKTLALLGLRMWLRVQQRANEYDETLGTFEDVEKWIEYWNALYARIIAASGETQSGSGGSFFWAAV
jgi:hypothetical protein